MVHVRALAVVARKFLINLGYVAYRFEKGPTGQHWDSRKYGFVQGYESKYRENPVNTMARDLSTDQPGGPSSEGTFLRDVYKFPTNVEQSTLAILCHAKGQKKMTGRKTMPPYLAKACQYQVEKGLMIAAPINPLRPLPGTMAAPVSYLKLLGMSLMVIANPSQPQQTITSAKVPAKKRVIKTSDPKRTSDQLHPGTSFRCPESCISTDLQKSTRNVIRKHFARDEWVAILRNI